MSVTALDEQEVATIKQTINRKINVNITPIRLESINEKIDEGQTGLIITDPQSPFAVNQPVQDIKVFKMKLSFWEHQINISKNIVT